MKSKEVLKMLDTQDWHEIVTCFTCGTEIQRGCMVFGECGYCRNKAEEHKLIHTNYGTEGHTVEQTLQLKQIKRLQYLLKIGLTANGRCFKTKKGAIFKQRYLDFIRKYGG
jgi:hypothetical protein